MCYIDEWAVSLLIQRTFQRKYSQITSLKLKLASITSKFTSQSQRMVVGHTITKHFSEQRKVWKINNQWFFKWVYGNFRLITLCSDCNQKRKLLSKTALSLLLYIFQIVHIYIVFQSSWLKWQLLKATGIPGCSIFAFITLQPLRLRETHYTQQEWGLLMVEWQNVKPETPKKLFDQSPKFIYKQIKTQKQEATDEHLLFH